MWGESQVSNDFPKIVDMIPDERRLNRGKPGLNPRGLDFQHYATTALNKLYDGYGRRLLMESAALMSPTCVEASLRTVIIDSCILSLTLKRLRRSLDRMGRGQVSLFYQCTERSFAKLKFIDHSK